MVFNEKKHINKVAYICHSIMCIVLFGSYLMEGFSKTRSWGYVALIFALTIIPVIANTIILKNRPDTPIFKHVIGTTYSLFYIIVLFTSNSQITFLYAFPMFFIVTLFADVFYCSLIGTGGVLANVISLFYFYSKGELEISNADFRIRIFACLLISIYMVVTTMTINKTNKEKFKVIENEKLETKKMYDNCLEIASNVESKIDNSLDKINTLAESLNTTKELMGQVDMGITETAGSIQEQLASTETIQKSIETVEDCINKFTFS